MTFLIIIFVLIVFMYVMFYITNMEHIKFTKIVFNIVLALLVGAPIGGFLMFIFTDALSNLGILPRHIIHGVYHIIGAIVGIYLGFIVVMVIRFRHDEHTQIPSSFYEHNQYRKRKNDDKPKNFPSFPSSDKRINDNRR